MTDIAWDDERLRRCRNGNDLRQELDAICAGIARVLNVTMLCGHGTPQKRLCIVDFVPSAITINIGILAERLGGKPFGHASIVVSLALAPDFECRRGPLIPEVPCSCTPRNETATHSEPPPLPAD